MSKRKFESLAAGEGGGAGTSAGDEGGGGSGTPQHRPMLKSKVPRFFVPEWNLGACGTAPGLILGGTVSVWFLQRLPSAGGNHCVTAPEQILDAG